LPKAVRESSTRKVFPAYFAVEAGNSSGIGFSGEEAFSDDLTGFETLPLLDGFFFSGGAVGIEALAG
jgi:hypothetical protein